jgi:hypothetical protein
VTVTLGILLLQTSFPRIPGDIGNPASYDFPVVIKVVPGATVQHVVRDQDESLLQEFVNAALQLEAEGVSAITSSCGFLSPFQETVARAVKVPVFLSSLLQVPWVYAITRRRVAILTAHAGNLNPHVLSCAGIDSHIPLAISGLEKMPAFSRSILDDQTELRYQDIREEVLACARTLLAQHPDIGAYVLECHNLAPYSKAVQETIGLPVFDIMDFVYWVYGALNKRDYPFPKGIEV